jgi:O-antigen ligase/polysaccharide polymerase Wzy-like membrane protein
MIRFVRGILMGKLLLPFIGIFLATPLIAQSIPLLGRISWAFLLVLAIVFCFWAHKLSNWSWRHINFLVLLLLLTAAFYFYGILITEEGVSLSIWKGFLRGCCFIMLAIIVTGLLDGEDGAGKAKVVLQWFMASAAFIAILAAVLGAIKYSLLLDSIYIEIIAKHSSTSYPWGTSLLRDSNFFSLTLLVGAIVMLQYWSKARTWKKTLFWALMIGLVIGVGIYAGSRRFWILTPLMLVAHLIFTAFRLSSVDYKKKLFVLVMGLIISIQVLTGIFSGHFSLRSLTESISQENQTQNVTLGLNYGARLESLLDKESGYGANPRIERWRYALELSKADTMWLGDGFSYRTKFGCKFLDCKGEDYPHNALLSALLYGGVLAMLVIFVLVGYSFYSALVLLWAPNGSIEIGLSMISTMMFTIISGDTFFSMPVFLAMLILTRIAIISLQEKQEGSIEG